MILIDRKGELPLYRQIFQQISERILRGEWCEGERIPSSRDLACSLEISRKPVLEAYELLTAEGFIENRVGAGSFVASGVRLHPPPKRRNSEHLPVGFLPVRQDIVDFRSGLPDLSSLPIARWQKLNQEVLFRAAPMDFAYQQPEGRIELRQEICRYLGRHRGLFCRPEQLVITSGTTQAIGIIGALFQDHSGICLLENPVTRDIPQILQARGMEIHRISVDEKGCRPQDFPQNYRPSFAYLTPSHQYPLGSVMPVERRIRWIELARERNFYLVEDDYDSEFRYQGPPVSTLCSLAPERVIYIGTFSKTLFPALRTAYLVLPEEWIDRSRKLKWITDLHNAPLNQLVLAEFLKEGAYTRHLLRMRKLYRKKRDLLLELIEKYTPAPYRVLGHHTGMHLCIQFPGRIFNQDFLDSLEEKGARVYPLWEHQENPEEGRDTFILGFGHLDEEKLKRGIPLLCQAVAES